MWPKLILIQTKGLDDEQLTETVCNETEKILCRSMYFTVLFYASRYKPEAMPNNQH